MRTASISEAKNNLSKLIDGLRRGPVMILDRGRPVAKLEAASQEDAGAAHLIRSGEMAAGEGTLPKDFFTRPLPELGWGKSALRYLIEERRNSR